MLMKNFKIPLLLGLTVTLIAGLLASCGVSSSGGEAIREKLRVVHAAQTLGKITILKDEKEIIQDLSYGAASDYIELDENAESVFSIRVDPEFVIPVLAVEEDVTGPYKKTLLVTEVAGQPVFTFIQDKTTTEIPSGESRIRFVNAAASATTMDVYVTGFNTSLSGRTPVVSALAFKGTSSYFPTDPGDYRIRIAIAAASTGSSSSSTASAAASSAATSAATSSTSSESTTPEISFDSKLYPVGAGEEITFYMLDDRGGGKPFRSLSVTSDE
jgi:hypothetical protein